MIAPKLSNPPDLFHIPVAVIQSNPVVTQALLDTGALRDFIDKTFALNSRLDIHPSKTRQTLHLADGRQSIVNEEIMLTVLVGEDFQPYKSTSMVAPLEIGPIVLGAPFFRKAQPILDWDTSTIRPPSNSTNFKHPRTENLHISRISAEVFNAIDNEPKGAIYLRSITVDPPPLKDLVPVEYYDFLDVFSEAEASKLPPHRPFDHRIPLIEGAQPSFGPIYSLSITEQEALRDYLDKNLQKGFIVPSELPAASPILFVKKKDKSLRLCVDYRKLNNITVKNRYPLPLIGDLLDQLRAAVVFSKIDLRGAYNLLRIAAGEEWKTAFRTCFGLFEYRVMPFGLTNAPASFQHLMNHIFRDVLDIYVIVYLDDILIFSRNMDKHREHVREVLRRLRKFELFAKHDKCQFHTDQVEFLGYIIDSKGVSMDPGKVKAVATWPEPKSVKETQSFLGFANFYRRCIGGFAKIAKLLHELTKKDSTFRWTESQQTAFDSLKTKMSTAPVLRHYDLEMPCIVETDSSDFAIGAVFSQRDGEGSVRPVAYASRVMLPAELNYSIHDKEFLAIVYTFKEWRHYLEGSQQQIQVLTDHRSLETFLTTKQLTRRQARWAEFIAGRWGVLQDSHRSPPSRSPQEPTSRPALISDTR